MMADLKWRIYVGVTRVGNLEWQIWSGRAKGGEKVSLYPARGWSALD